MDNIIFTPMIPEWVLIILGGLSALLVVLGAIRAPVTAFLRLIALALLLLLLARPAILDREETPLDSIMLLVTDRSGSQALDGRDSATTRIVTTLTERAERLDGLALQTIDAGDQGETRLNEAIATGLAGIARDQLAGVVVVSDGNATDETLHPEELGIDAPVHLILTGRDGETDRRLSVISAPRFGIVNETAKLTFRVDDTNTGRTTANVILRINGEEVLRQTVRVNEDITVTAPLDQPGRTVVELSAAPVPGELTSRNNRAIQSVSVVRDRLRVLLVSGEPHAGERTWRNLLKSDPAVDLIHFTILKPATKRRAVPDSELSLIRFPENELFLEKLSEFDVVIFDRYTYRGVISPLHFDNIARYIEQGGAMLIASGPEFIGPTSLAERENLAYLLPALPDGRVSEAPFRPALSTVGSRHPVTGDLGDADAWGRWVRSIGVAQRGGQTLMSTERGDPLLIVDRVGEGRVGLLLSDHVWLWARGFDGGGPHRELLRRLVHWLMQEPELEEEAIRLSGGGSPEAPVLTITRRTIADEVYPVSIEAPDGTTIPVELSRIDSGRWEATLPVDQQGLYTASTPAPDSRMLFDIAAIGLDRPPEFDQVLMTADPLTPLIDATGGGVFTVRNADGMAVPTLRLVRPDRKALGRSGDAGWLGLYDRDAARVDRVVTRPVLPGWAWLALAAGLVVLAWLYEAFGSARLLNRQGGR